MTRFILHRGNVYNPFGIELYVQRRYETGKVAVYHSAVSTVFETDEMGFPKMTDKEQAPLLTVDYNDPGLQGLMAPE